MYTFSPMMVANSRKHHCRVRPCFPDFGGKLHGSILWKDKAIPTISIDGLQSSLHKVFQILEDSWFKIVEEQSNAHNFH
ncbi:hypothetical protein Tco_0662041 [Tanacetum coccineum]